MSTTTTPTTFEEQLYDAWSAAGLSASPCIIDGSLTFVCPVCPEAESLDVFAGECSCRRCDWAAKGSPAEIVAKAKQKQNPIPVASVLTRPLASLERPTGNEDELIKDRFLCKGGGMLLVGPSGIGKSSLSMQCMILWALGRECFGLRPARPLRSVLIQAENDDGDLAEMRDGVIRGLGLSAEEQAKALANVSVHTCDTLSGDAFLSQVVAPIAASQTMDLLWLDPALAYIGGDVKSQEVVGGFLRNGLNPILHKYNCATVIVHHTNKPPSGQEKATWAGNDLAYLGSGSAEWANWARAVVAVRGLGSHEVFQLVLGKRGARAGWVGEEGERIYHRSIAHAKEPGAICWRPAAADEVPEAEPARKGRVEVWSPEKLLKLLGDDQLTHAEILKRAIIAGWGKSTFGTKWEKLKDLRLIEESKAEPGEWRARKRT
jgi:hypothetical protein